MTPPDPTPDPAAERLSPRTRRYAGGLALSLVLLLALASQLTPDPRGFGTHEQLGLGECNFVRLWDIGCPSCGMTTSWSYLMRGNLRGAAGANVAGLLLGLFALAAIPWLLASAIRGRWCYLRPTMGLLLPFVAVVVTVALYDWFRRWGWELALDKFGFVS